MKRARWSLRRARVLLGTKFLLIAGLVGFVVVAWLAELVVGLHRPIYLGPLLAGQRRRSRGGGARDGPFDDRRPIRACASG